MAKLIGNGPNQVPTNGDLGTLAFQDSDSVAVENLKVSELLIDSSGTISQNGVGKAAFSFYRPGSTEVTVRCWLPNYSTAIIKFTYAHTNDADSLTFMEVAVNNSYGRIRTQTIASKMTFGFGTISFGAAADNVGGNSNYVYFTVPAANASGSYGAITMEGTSQYWFEKI